MTRRFAGSDHLHFVLLVMIQIQINDSDPDRVIAMNTTTTNSRTADVAARVRAALDAEGYTLTETAERVGISKSQMSRLLNGKSSFRLDHLITLGQFLGISAREFLGVTRPQHESYLTVIESAERANRHPQTIRKAIYAGQLPSVQPMARGHHLISAFDLDSWLAGIR